jgi:hypothetical protein
MSGSKRNTFHHVIWTKGALSLWRNWNLVGGTLSMSARTRFMGSQKQVRCTFRPLSFFGFHQLRPSCYLFRTDSNIIIAFSHTWRLRDEETNYQNTATKLRIAVKFSADTLPLTGPGKRSRYSYSLLAGRSGGRIGVRFSAPVQTGPGSHRASYTMGTGSFPGVKRPGLGVDHPPPSSAKVKETVELYIYSPSGPSWHLQGVTSLLPSHCR